LIAVCGAAPSGHPDAWDAAAWIYPAEPVRRGADLRLRGQGTTTWKPHKFTEIARDCAFAGDTLVMVGEANGNMTNS
jgi:hypothetical protein